MLRGGEKKEEWKKKKRWSKRGYEADGKTRSDNIGK